MSTLVLIHITIFNCEKETNDAKRRRQKRILLLSKLFLQVNQVMSKADKWTDHRMCVRKAV